MQRHRVLIVDGYNVIRNNARYSDLGPDYEGGSYWNDAREALINDAAYYTVAEGYERCTVVFDGAGNPLSSGKPQSVTGVSVVFSPRGRSADSVIEKLAYDARVQGFEVVVVSSDFTVQSTVFGGGVTRMSSSGFGMASAQLEESWQENAKRPSHVKNTVAERVSPEVVEKLRRMRDGDSR